jgi:hypothetical protein
LFCVVEVEVDRRVVDQDVDPPNSLRDASASAFALASLDTSTALRHGARADRGAFLRGRFGRFDPKVGDDDVRAFAREPECVRLADALRGTRDDRHLVAESHGRAA